MNVHVHIYYLYLISISRNMISCEKTQGLPFQSLTILRVGCIVRWFGFGGEAAAEVATWPRNLGVISGSVSDYPPEKTTVCLHFAPYPFVWGGWKWIYLIYLPLIFCLLKSSVICEFFFGGADCRR